MKNQESKLQQTCVRWFRFHYPDYHKLLFAIPNGGKRNAVTASILKAEGVVAGVADLFLAVPSPDYHGLFIEMKYGKGKQSPEQVAFQKAVIMQGYRYEVVRSFDEFMGLVNSYLKK